MKELKMFRRKTYSVYEMTEDGRLVEPKIYQYGRYVTAFSTYYGEEEVWEALEEYSKGNEANFVVITTYEIS
jgi:hypothetical protein